MLSDNCHFVHWQCSYQNTAPYKLIVPCIEIAPLNTLSTFNNHKALQVTVKDQTKAHDVIWSRIIHNYRGWTRKQQTTVKCTLRWLRRLNLPTRITIPVPRAICWEIEKKEQHHTGWNGSRACIFCRALEEREINALRSLMYHLWIGERKWVQWRMILIWQLNVFM